MLIVDQMRTVLCLSLQEKSTVLLAVPKATHVALIDAYWSLCLALFHPALIQDCASVCNYTHLQCNDNTCVYIQCTSIDNAHYHFWCAASLCAHAVIMQQLT